VALERNTTARYQCRWVDLTAVPGNPSVFLKGVECLHVPVAHGEGNFYASPEVLAAIEEKKLVALRYARPDGSPAGGEFPYNPNGSVNDIAAISDGSGRILGMMPHPERNILFTQRDDWTYLREKARREGTRPPEESEGLALFRNAVGYFE
jgi:phosphoribosylformylglycinamidine synthase